MEGEDSSSSSVLVVEDGDGLDAAAGERDEPVADVGVGGECMTGVEGETGDAGTCVAAEYAVDGRGGRTVGEGEGEPGEGLPSAAPGVGDRGGRGASGCRPAGVPGGRTEGPSPAAAADPSPWPGDSRQ